jgi:methyl-accepting chemotaxis protein
MHWFHNIRIAQKLLLLFALVIAMLVINNVVALMRVRAINDKASQVIHNWMPAIYYLGAMQSNLNEMRIAELRHVMEDTAHVDIMAAVKDGHNEAIEKYHANERHYAMHLTAGWETDKYKRLQEVFVEYERTSRDIITLSEQGRKQEARALITGITRKLRGEAAQIIIDVSEFNMKLGSQDGAEAAALVQNTQSTVIVGTSVLVLLIVVLAFGVGGEIARRLRRLHRAINQVAEGDTNVQVTVDGTDELGQLAHRFNTMTANVREAIATAERTSEQAQEYARTAEILKAQAQGQERYLSEGVSAILNEMERLAAGNLSARLTVQSNDDLGRLSFGFNRVAENLHGIIAGVRHAAAEANDISTHIRSAMHELSATTEDQTKQTSTVASAVEQMSFSIAANAQHAGQAAQVANTNNTDAVSSAEVMHRTLDKMRDIAEMVHRSATIVQKLGDSSEQIQAIVSTIDEIADQTNLLALNAAIEAARAGEQGRGFAVVADEVRKLAERTSEATKEIAATVTHIQHDTQEAVRSMRHGNNEVQSGIELADTAGQALERIVSGMNDVRGMMSQIAADTQQQSSTSDHIARSVDAMSSAIVETSHTVHEVARSSENMEHLMQRLLTNVEQFRG